MPRYNPSNLVDLGISKTRYGCKWTWETIQHYINSSKGTALLLLFCISKSQSGLQQWAKVIS